MIPLAPDVVRADARGPFHSPSDSVDFIVHEHVIAHVDLSSARRLRGEFARVRRRGGGLRITTADLGRLTRFATRDEARTDDAAVHVRTMNAGICDVPEDDIDNTTHRIYRVVRDWAHLLVR